MIMINLNVIYSQYLKGDKNVNNEELLKNIKITLKVSGSKKIYCPKLPMSIMVNIHIN